MHAGRVARQLSAVRRSCEMFEAMAGSTEKVNMM